MHERQSLVGRRTCWCFHVVWHCSWLDCVCACRHNLHIYILNDNVITRCFEIYFLNLHLSTYAPLYCCPLVLFPTQHRDSETYKLFIAFFPLMIRSTNISSNEMLLMRANSSIRLRRLPDPPSRVALPFVPSSSMGKRYPSYSRVENKQN